MLGKMDNEINQVVNQVNQVNKANKDRITNLILDREEGRKVIREQRKVIKDLDSAANEQVQYFRNEFDEKLAEIDEILMKIKTIPKESLPQVFDDVSKRVTLLQKFVSASTFFLKEYEVRRCQQLLHASILLAKESEALLIPKKKFGFKNKKLVKKVDVTAEDDVDLKRNVPKNYLLDFCGFDSVDEKKLKLTGEEIFQKDVTLSHLNKCTVLLFGAPNTLHISNLNDSIVLCGPVFTSIFVENCVDCKFVFACQQLRLHQSKQCDIYLHVTSRGIIEYCQGIQIAPYNLSYCNIEFDFERSTLDRKTNNWNSIDDFNWLAADKESPNWKVMDVKDRCENWHQLIQDFELP